MGSTEEVYLGLVLGLVVATSKMLCTNPRGVCVNALILYALIGFRIGFGMVTFVRFLALCVTAYFLATGRTNIAVRLLQRVADKNRLDDVLSNVRASVYAVIPEAAKEQVSKTYEEIMKMFESS